MKTGFSDESKQDYKIKVQGKKLDGLNGSTTGSGDAATGSKPDG